MLQALIGVDWGTHSSKWNWMRGDGSFVPGQFKIIRSDVRLNEKDNRIFLSVESPTADSVFEFGVKGKLIRDPDVPFWVGPRRRMKLTLGELVTFSLWSLLSEAYADFLQRSPAKPKNVEVRFSLPNWVGIAEAAVARSSYQQAAYVACQIFLKDRSAWSREPNPTREAWKKIVDTVRTELSISDDSEIDSGGFHAIIDRVFTVDEALSFRFVAESSAAGLTGLREIEAELRGRKYLRKILIVDVGAGSTDIGYVLRSIPNVGVADEALLQFPPANTCQIAGEALTRTIVEIYRGIGQKIGLDEAERRKTRGSDKNWAKHPSVDQWRRGIAEHVETYVRDVVDEHWLPTEPGLQVLVTGGSGIVDGLQEEVLAAAKRALEHRKAMPRVISATSLMTLDTNGPWADDVNRLAVALGAASEELPSLRYYDEGLGPAVPAVPVRAARGWV